MLKWIRWSGLIAFVVVVSGLAAFFMFLAGPLAKSAIERVGTAANGAVVDVKRVSLSFNPIGLNIQHMQITDAQNPMRNSIEFDAALAELELAPLLAGHVIIKQLGLTGLRFDTERKTSGHVAQSVKQQEKTPEAPSLVENLNLPDPKDILTRERNNLTTERLGQAIEEGYQSSQVIIKEKLTAVPNEASLKQYEHDVQRLVNSKVKTLEDFNAIKGEFEALKKQFKADQQAIQAAQAAVKNAKSQLNTDWVNLKNAPVNDLNVLKKKYQLNAQGAVNVSAALLGEETGAWAQKALYWYEKLQPYLSSETTERVEEKKETKVKEESIPRGGYFVQFDSAHPWPSFLLRHGQADAQTANGVIHVRVQDVTHQPKVLGRPSKLFAESTQLKNIGALQLNAIFDHTRRPAKDSLAFKLNDWTLNDMPLGVAGLSLAHAQNQLDATVLISQGQLQAQGMMDFSDARFTTKESSGMAKEIHSALSSITAFNIAAEASGGLVSPTIHVSSNLDAQLKKAMKNRLTEKQKEFERALEAQLQAQAAEVLGNQAKYLEQFNQMDGSLSEKMTQVQALARAELDDFVQQQKEEAVEKVKTDVNQTLKSLIKR